MRKVTAIAQACCAAAILVATGCGGNGLTGPTSSSSSSLTASGGSALASLRHFNDPTAVGTGGNPAITCSSEAPRIFHAGVLEKRLELQWQPVYNIHRYQVEVQFMGGGNHWLPFAFNTYVDQVLAEIYGESAGHYRLRVRNAEPTCPTEGSWSDWIILSIDGPPEPSPVVEEPEEPQQPPEPPGPPVEDDTLTYWHRSTGGDQAAESGCENPGGGQTGTYLGGGDCQLFTPAGVPVIPPQSGQWTQIPPPI